MRKIQSQFNIRARIYVAGHRGMVGSALVRALQARGATQLLYQTRSELDLRDPVATEAFFAQKRPEYVFLAAAKVGGIAANNEHRVEAIYDNLLIAAHTIQAAYRHKVKKLLFLGSSCIYPKHAPQPIREEHLLTGTLEPTNEPYAIAKIAGIKLCESYRNQYACHFISAMPTNLYGPGDNYDLQTSHVLPAILRKVHEAKETKAPTVEIWGTGTPKREFMHVDDLASACLLLMEKYEARPHTYPSFVNVGVGEDLSIAALAHLIKKIVGYRGDFYFNPAKPDGTPRKLLYIGRLKRLGFRPTISLETGIREVYKAYLKSLPS